jgi:dienelactone hydrolase
MNVSRARAAMPFLLTLACGWGALLVIAPRAAAQRDLPRSETLLTEARTATGLRAALMSYAVDARRRTPADAESAWLHAGRSYERAGEPDSAAMCYREALAVGGSNTAGIALADLLLQRARARDLLEAYQVVAHMLGRTPRGAIDRADVMLRSMWLHHLAGHADSAAAAFDEARQGRGIKGVWTVRAARVVLEHLRDPARAGELLLPIEVRSRGQDHEVHELLVRAVTAFGRPEADLAGAIERELEMRDLAEERLLARWDARRIPLLAEDGFLLPSVVKPAPPGAPAAVVLSMGDTLAHYDSLVAHLHAAGFAVILIEARGHGLSVGPPCPNPFRWAGREHAMEERLARDAVLALGALGELGPVDTTRAIVVGAGFTARAAMRAAELRPEFRAAVLASPEPAKVDRGLMLASVERVGRPLFLQTAPEDLVDLYYFTDALYQAGDRRASRVSSSVSPGRYAEQFNNDPASGRRLREWLAEVGFAPRR